MNCPELAHSLVQGRALVLFVLNGMVSELTATNSYKKYFDVSLTVHHSMDLFQLPTLIHNSFIY